MIVCPGSGVFMSGLKRVGVVLVLLAQSLGSQEGPARERRLEESFLFLREGITGGIIGPVVRRELLIAHDWLFGAGWLL